MGAMHGPAAGAASVGSIAGYRGAARACLDPTAWKYLEAGHGEELTLLANRRAFDQRTIMPRPLADVRGGHTRLELLGQPLDHPILIAPIAYQRLFHPQGEAAAAMAAAAQGSIFIISTLASQPLESIVAAAEGRCWFQLYWQGDRDRTLRLVRRAQAAGISTVVLTIDAPVKEASMELPAHVSAVNLEAQPRRIEAVQNEVFDGWMARAPRWDDLAWLRDQVSASLLVKGVLHADDAERAVTLGLDALIVSNHGGRVLDSTLASCDVLPAVLERIGGRIPVLIDSGIRSGRDVFKALALGAAAVLVGRPVIWGLASAGALGVAHIIRILRDELEMTMALAGHASLREVAAVGLS